MKHYYLKVVYGPNIGLVHPLTGEQPVVMGRHSHCDVRLKDRGVSRRHAALSPEGDGWNLVDLGTPNQTFVNGEPVSNQPLNHDDQIRVGSTLLLFYESEVAPLKETASSTSATELTEGATASKDNSGGELKVPDFDADLPVAASHDDQINEISLELADQTPVS